MSDLQSATPNFTQAAWRFCSDQEGDELSLDPEDPGNIRPDGSIGGSRWGITSRDHPDVDIISMTYDAASELFTTGYWHPCGSIIAAKGLPGLGLLMTDAACTSSTRSAIRTLQAVVDVSADGVLGGITLGGIDRWLKDQHGRTIDLCAAYAAERLEHLSTQVNWQHYKSRLIARQMEALAVAIEWSVIWPLPKVRAVAG